MRRRSGCRRAATPDLASAPVTARPPGWPACSAALTWWHRWSARPWTASPDLGLPDTVPVPVTVILARRPAPAAVPGWTAQGAAGESWRRRAAALAALGGPGGDGQPTISRPAAAVPAAPPAGWEVSGPPWRASPGPVGIITRFDAPPPPTGSAPPRAYSGLAGTARSRPLRGLGASRVSASTIVERESTAIPATAACPVGQLEAEISGDDAGRAARRRRWPRSPLRRPTSVSMTGRLSQRQPPPRRHSGRTARPPQPAAARAYGSHCTRASPANAGEQVDGALGQRVAQPVERAKRRRPAMTRGLPRTRSAALPPPAPPGCP